MANFNAGGPTGVQKYAASVGNGISTSIVVTHSLGTTDVVVMVYGLTAPNDVVMVDIEITSANTVTLNFATAPALNAYRIIVTG
jgi:hypothetical protein